MAIWSTDSDRVIIAEACWIASRNMRSFLPIVLVPLRQLEFWQPDTAEVDMADDPPRVIRRFTRSRIGPCDCTFKDQRCGYAGPASWCNKTFERCRELDNQANFRGAPVDASQQHISRDM